MRCLGSDLPGLPDVRSGRVWLRARAGDDQQRLRLHRALLRFRVLRELLLWLGDLPVVLLAEQQQLWHRRSDLQLVQHLELRTGQMRCVRELFLRVHRGDLGVLQQLRLLPLQQQSGLHGVPMITTLTLLMLCAAPWDQGFEPGAVATYLDRQNASLVVMTGGVQTDSSRTAQASLVNALRLGGQTRLVMTGESIAVLAADTDSELVKKASYLPVDLIIVLRLFPGGANSPEVAVATLYNKEGTSTGAMAVTAGQPLPKREGVGRQSAGRAAVAEVLESARDRPESSRSGTPQPEGTGDPRKITFEAGVMVNLRNGQVVSTWIMPYLAGRPLSGVRFYETIGRADLVASYKGRNGLKIGLIAGGSAVALAGAMTALFTINPPCAVRDGRSGSCLQTQYPNLVLPGLLASVAGLGTLIAGLVINPNPVRPQQLVELAEEYNGKLGAVKASRATGSTPVTVSAALLPTPEGVSGSLRLQF